MFRLRDERFICIFFLMIVDYVICLRNVGVQ